MRIAYGMRNRLPSQLSFWMQALFFLTVKSLGYCDTNFNLHFFLYIFQLPEKWGKFTHFFTNFFRILGMISNDFLLNHQLLYALLRTWMSLAHRTSQEIHASFLSKQATVILEHWKYLDFSWKRDSCSSKQVLLASENIVKRSQCSPIRQSLLEKRWQKSFPPPCLPGHLLGICWRANNA